MCFSSPSMPTAAVSPPTPPPPAPDPAPISGNEQDKKDAETAGTLSSNKTGRQSLLIPLNSTAGGTPATAGINIPA